MMDRRAPLPLHRLHDEDIEQLFASGERRAELSALFGPRGYRELAALARRAAETRTRGGAVVYVLPGLMGSRIGTRGRLLDDVLWLDPIEIVAGHLTRLALPRGSRLSALGVMLLNALKLKLSLVIAGFDARFHAYDWRLGVEGLAAELNTRIKADGVGDVMVVGHSMGGVVARVALASGAGRISRVVQIGAPNGGSFAPVLALRGVYVTVRKLAALDLRHDAEDLARLVFRSLPSLHELLPDPALTGGPDFFDPATWPRDTLRPDPRLLLDAAAALRRRPAADPRCLHIIGVRQETVTGAEPGTSGFDFRVTHEGDGTVPRVLAEMPGVPTWFVPEKHGGLPNNGRVISAVADLLREGTTRRLPSSTRRAKTPRARVIAESTLRRIAPHKVRWQDLSPDARRRLLEPVVSPEFHGEVSRRSLRAPAPVRKRAAATTGRGPGGAPGGVAAPPRRRVIEIRLSSGSIVDANARALVLGVFSNVDPSGAAAAVDARLGGAVREFTFRRMLSGRLGEAFVLPCARSQLLAEFVLFVGLGDFPEFGSSPHMFAAENAVRTLTRARAEDFATVLFGTGSGTPVAAALEHQLGGFFAALRSDDDHVIRRITICETNSRRYASIRRALPRVLARLAGPDIEVVVDEAAPLPAGAGASSARTGASARPPHSPESTTVAGPGAGRPAQRMEAAVAAAGDPAYLLVSMTEHGRGDYQCSSALLTAGAKAAVLGGKVTVARTTLRSLLSRAGPDSLTTKDLARYGDELAKLLLAGSVRGGLEAMVGRPLVIVHDREASRVPWETLRVAGVHPALEGGLSRRYTSEALSVARWRDEHMADGTMRVLMVVNPTLDLPGAAQEGNALRETLLQAGASVDMVAGAAASRSRLLREMGSGQYDVLHFAGHGFFDAGDPGTSGLVCANGTVLRGADLEGISSLPALVFFNACEAARVRRGAQGSIGGSGRRARRIGSANRRSMSARARLFGLRQSSSLAEAILDGGVANFVGTHWPVGDESALAFSKSLYSGLLGGARLGDAMMRARRQVLSAGSIDWADYVHYGNPGFRLGPEGD
jgi:pimeloyl-ACP methyl ester carboxylesterase